MPLTALLATISGFLPEAIAGYFFTKGMDKFLESGQSLQDELQDVIQETIIEFADADLQTYGRNLPFYHSVSIIEELLRFRVMAPEDYQPEQLIQVLSSESNVIPPSEKDLNDFFSLFMIKINQSDSLRKLEIKETFSQEIFNISRRINELLTRIDNLALQYTGDLELQWKDRVDSYVKTLQDFKPATALKLLQSLELSLQSSSKRPSANFMAFLEYQKGQCYGFLDRKEDAYRAKIKAWNMDVSNILHAQSAAISFFRMKDEIALIKIINDILKLDGYNPVAWALRTLTEVELDFELSIKNVPQFVRNDSTFQRVIYNEADAKFQTILRMQGLVPSCLSYQEKEVTIDGFNEAIFWINSAVTEIFQVFYLDYYSNSQEDRGKVAILNKMLTRFLDKVRGSELTDNFEKLEFLKTYTEFSLTGEQSFALALEAIYKRMLNKELILAIKTANVLQLSGLVEKAVALLEKETELNSEALLLLLFCYLKNDDIDGYCEASKKYVKSIHSFENRHLLMYLNLMVELRLLGLASRFKIEDFIDGKTYIIQEDRRLVESVAALIFDAKKEEVLSFLRKVAEESQDAKLVDILGSAFFAAEAYDLALNTLARNLDGKTAGRELYQYIQAHNKTGKDYTELLKLLENWRLNLPFNPQFCRLEAQLRQSLVDWETVVSICEHYLGHLADDSAMLAVYANALHLLNTPESIQKIDGVVDLAKTSDFNHPANLIAVCDILFLHGKRFEAFELLYPHALDPKAIQVRAAYTKLVFHKDENLSFFIEYEVAQAGHFVKYERDGVISYVELVKDALDHSVFKLFIGKAKDEEISVKRKLMNLTDIFVIKRIMNKFLALFDQILNQSETDPHAGLPFSMMKFDSDKPGSFFEMMQSMFGDRHKIAQQTKDADFDAYYNGSLSLSELVARQYDQKYTIGYYNLIIYHNGINTIQRNTFSNHSLSQASQLVIDLSSLLLFYQIWLTHQWDFEQKFILSKYIQERIRFELNNLQYGADRFDTSGIEFGRVATNESSFEFQKDRAVYLSGLLKWIDNNCNIELSDKTIELIKKTGINVGENQVIDASMSTLLLITDEENRVLITDDSFSLRMNLLPLDRIMSTEHYLKLKFMEDAVILDELVKNRYIRYSPTARQLGDEYIKMLSGQSSNYSLMLDNLSLINDRGNLETALEHLKEIALKPMLTRDQIILDMCTVFVSILRDCNFSFIDLFGRKVLIDFALLGTKQDDALLAFKSARKIIYESRRIPE
jgi:hypothetical protein